jgi:hypothetical protein
LLSTSAFARDTNKGTLALSENVTVDGHSLNSGRYTVEWNGNGPSVQVAVLQGKHTIASFPAHLSEEAAATAQDAYGTTVEPDGSKQLTVIYPGGKRLALQVVQNGTTQPSTEHPSK